MRSIERQVAKEGAASVLLDELDRVVGEVVDDIPLALDDLAVVVEMRAELVAPVARAEPVVLVESARLAGELTIRSTRGSSGAIIFAIRLISFFPRPVSARSKSLVFGVSDSAFACRIIVSVRIRTSPEGWMNHRQ